MSLELGQNWEYSSYAWLASANNVKKMFSKKKRVFPHNEIADFIPPRRHDGASSYIWFSQYDPQTGRMRRKKYMLDRFKPGRERDTAAARIICNIYNKVSVGWNVWSPENTFRSDTPVEEAVSRYRAYIYNVHMKGVLKHKTYYDYNSRLKIFSEYISEMVQPVRTCIQLTQTFFVDFLDYLLIDRDLSAVTRNNYRTWCSAFCSWLVEKKYIAENPIQFIHQLPEQEKRRQPLTHEDLRRLGEYLEHANRHFLLAVLMEYTTAIRPTELSYIRLRDINVSEGSVFVSSQVSKNRRDGKIKLPNRVIRLMADLGTFGHHSDCYLFGKGFVPSETRHLPVQFTLEFNKCRDILGFPKTYQFYSLKDSGLRDIANAVGVEVAQKQARHSDISTTNRYLKGSGLYAVDSLADFEGYL